MSPGAVPICWGMGVAPTGTSAWRPLLSGMSRPRELNSAAMRSTISGSRTRGTFMTSAMASRVMSSWVGPSPPHTTTPSLRARAVRRASTMRAWLSPTAWWKWESTPASASCSPIHAELVSTIWPRSSSVPTARTSILIGAIPRRARPSAGRAGRRGGTARPVTTVKATATHTATDRTPRCGATDGARHSRMAMPWTRVFTLAVARAGIEIPRRPTAMRYTLIHTSRARDDRPRGATTPRPWPPRRTTRPPRRPCRPAGRGRRPSGSCPGGAPAIRRRRR